MAKKKPDDDHKLTVPQADLTLGDLPITQEKVDILDKMAMFNRQPEFTWRAETAKIFHWARKEGLAAVADLWGRQWPHLFAKAGPKNRFLKNDMAQQQWLIEQMADGLTLFEACKKAVEEGRVTGAGTAVSIARRLMRRHHKPTMNAAAEALRKRRSCT